MVLEYGGFADTVVGINFKKWVSVSVSPSNINDIWDNICMINWFIKYIGDRNVKWIACNSSNSY